MLLFGLTAILGDLISTSAPALVWWRVLITCISLLFFVGFGRKLLGLSPPLILKIILIGFVVALHWITFFGSIKASNASVTLVCMATATLFTAFLEPLILSKKIIKMQVLIGCLLIPAMFMIARQLPESMMTGVYLGLCSAFLAALFSCFNKKLVDSVNPFNLTFLELFGVWVFLTCLLPFFWHQFFVPFRPMGIDWIYLLILALACTSLAFYLNIVALKKLSAFETNLIINLEPVYGILLAIIILKEHQELSPNFYLGAFMILAIVFAYPLINNWTKSR